MNGSRSIALVTGVSGGLGLRLVPMLTDFEVAGIDMVVPPAEFPVDFEQMDLGREVSCRALVSALRETAATAVVHLGIVNDPVQAGTADEERQWQVNVAGTARVMEAITEVNRTGGTISKCIVTTGASAYGSDLGRPVTEQNRLMADSLVSAIHQREADEVVQFWAPSLGPCSTFILRPALYAGAGARNYMLDGLSGTPGGKSRRAAKWRDKGRRIPLALPFRQEHLENPLLQFVHLDDVARLIAYILRRRDTESAGQILNVAGRGYPVSFAEAVQVSQQRVLRKSRWGCRRALSHLWGNGISTVPPEAFSYMISPCILDVSRLRKFLGSDYESVIRYTALEALKDSFRAPEHPTESTPQPEGEVVV